ncbi:hypothetical protein GCG54_00006508 [Colletotrichum gloeosporioides]|uniref:Uncharacterized protein n=1 Tax=Colletotrichum gloeosporioides TaxID=474922 RepID=A0A8H4CRM4_COLGL|nr:uncharacterized protein GCG54_00006508 [Colletotrichum gloeosporioides]KAF3808642.1 hypothetical protein GCG54_00006508 [Colletotrichum gloeosporioides]
MRTYSVGDPLADLNVKADFENQTPGQSLALTTFERLSEDILRLAREMGMDSRQINFTRVQQEQLRLLFVKANKTIDASKDYVKGVENHRNYAQHYSVQLEDAAEKYDFLSSDYRRNKADLEAVKVKIGQLDSKVTKEMEAMKREIKELRELVKTRAV